MNTQLHHTVALARMADLRLAGDRERAAKRGREQRRAPRARRRRAALRMRLRPAA